MKNHLRKQSRRLGGIVVLIMITFPIFAKERIEWLVMDFPPRYILEGEYKGKGIADEQLKIYQKKMDGYEHTFVKVNFPRALQEMKLKKSVCLPALFKTPERERFLYYSLPNDLLLPETLFIRKEDWELFNKAKVVSMESVLRNSKLEGGIQQGRSYTKVLDTILNKYKGQDHLKTYSKSKQLIQMLSHRRFNYIIETPLTVEYWSKQLDMQPFISIPIEEYQSHSLIYVACPKNEWGQRVIRKINAILLAERSSSRYKEFTERWIPANLLPYYRKLYSEYILTNG